MKENGKRGIISWCMYDWANSAFATTILAAVLPIFYSEVAANGIPKTTATSYWGYTNTIAMVVVAFSSPILGSIADYTAKRKRFLFLFTAMGVTATGLLFLIQQGQWLAASALFILGRIGFGGGNIFYDSLLPFVAHEEIIDQVSSFGYALGYLGGGVLLAINLLMIKSPGSFLIPDAVCAMRLSFLSVALWWALFSLPLFLVVPEPGHSPPRDLSGVVRKSIRELLAILDRITDYREPFKFLMAFWLYNDGIGTIIVMAAIFGAEIGINRNHLIGSILLVQFVGIPFTILFGKMARYLGTKTCILIGLMVYIIVAIYGYFLKTPSDFLVLAIMVGLVQGGTQALSRSFFARMIPAEDSSKFFSFYDVTSKFSGIMGPALFGLVAQFSGSSRYGIVALVVFFIAGGTILLFVNPPTGPPRPPGQPRPISHMHPGEGFPPHGAV
ncbi:MAG: MFS transporter [bacterium]